MALLFGVLVARFFRREALPDHPALRIALRYGSAAVLVGSGVGVVMSIFSRGRFVHSAGNLMPIHAAGFHGLQAVPIVALLLGWAAIPVALARRWTHVAGIAWLLGCVGLVAQAVEGQPPLASRVPLVLSVAGALLWAGALIYAWRSRIAHRVMKRNT